MQEISLFVFVDSPIQIKSNKNRIAHYIFYGVTGQNSQMIVDFPEDCFAITKSIHPDEMQHYI